MIGKYTEEQIANFKPDEIIDGRTYRVPEKYTRVFESHEDGYKKLKRVADLATEQVDGTGVIFAVDTVWFDYGQDWMWTTILKHDPSFSFGPSQALYPRQQEMIICEDECESVVMELVEAVRTKEKTNENS